MAEEMSDILNSPMCYQGYWIKVCEQEWDACDVCKIYYSTNDFFYLHCNDKVICCRCCDCFNNQIKPIMVDRQVDAMNLPRSISEPLKKYLMDHEFKQ